MVAGKSCCRDRLHRYPSIIVFRFDLLADRTGERLLLKGQVRKRNGYGNLIRASANGEGAETKIKIPVP